MAISVPTVDDVHRMFCDTVTEATQGTRELEVDEFRRLWDDEASEHPVSGIEQLRIRRDLSLFRAHLTVMIHNSRASQFQAIQRQVDALASQLASLAPEGSSVRLLFEFPPAQVVPFGHETECKVRGIVEG
jgi:hypothetical protein